MKNYIPLYPPNIPKKSIYYLKKCVDENVQELGLYSTGDPFMTKNLFEFIRLNISSSPQHITMSAFYKLANLHTFF